LGRLVWFFCGLLGVSTAATLLINVHHIPCLPITFSSMYPCTDNFPLGTRGHMPRLA
jgi:hypothetical protein